MAVRNYYLTSALPSMGELGAAPPWTTDALLELVREAGLKDAGFMKEVLRELVMLYAQRDVAGGTAVAVNVSPELHAALADWAMRELQTGAGAAAGVSVELTKSLGQAGFEYTVEGATIEVTQSSVAAMLSELVGPELRATIDQALARTSV